MGQNGMIISDHEVTVVATLHNSMLTHGTQCDWIDTTDAQSTVLGSPTTRNKILHLIILSMHKPSSG